MVRGGTMNSAAPSRLSNAVESREHVMVLDLGGTGVRSVLHDTNSYGAKLESVSCFGWDEVDMVLGDWEVCRGSF